MQMKKNYLLALFTFVCGAEGDRQRRPLLQVKTGRVMVPDRRQNPKWKGYFMQLAGKAGHFTHGKNYLLPIFSFLCGTKGDEATSPSFVGENAAIDASSLSLEARSAA